MEFNVKKCKVMHVGRNNPNCEYIMAMTVLQTVSKERDIGLMVNQDLKPSLQCAEASRRASTHLGQITRTFLYWDRFTFLRLYTQFVRCHLEFAVLAWSPWTGHDIEILEKVQRRAVNLITGLNGRAYDEKLDELGLLSLKDRRTKLDLIQTYKILKGIDRVDHDTWFSKVGADATRLTRHTAYHDNLISKRSRSDVRQNFFSNRVVPKWNKLPVEVKETRTLNIFRTLLDSIDIGRL